MPHVVRVRVGVRARKNPLKADYYAAVLDPSAYENVEADRRSAMQSVIVVLAVCVAGGVGAVGFGLSGIPGFATGAIIALGAWLAWAVTIIALGTGPLAEPQTRSD